MIRIVVPGPPPRKNARYRVIRLGDRGSLRNSEKHEEFVVRLWMAAQGVNRISSGIWRLDVDAFWPRRTKLPEGGWIAQGDFDAPLSSISDALESVGVIDNDKRILDGQTRKHYDKHNPRVEIVLEEVGRG